MKQLIIFFAFVLFLRGTLGELACEELPIGLCSFSVASSGKRCILETYESNSHDGTVGYQCKSSEVMANVLNQYIESDECVNACGVDRNTVGIASDSLHETQFTSTLCSPKCFYDCPNIIDLYNNLALAEGLVLPELCESQTTGAHRSLIQSSSAAASPIPAAAGPIYAAADAPASNMISFSVDCAPSPV